MFSYAKAKSLAQLWIELNSQTEVQLIDEETISKTYGWVFFYQSKKYLETENFSEMLVGNAPILINRINGELKVLGTAHTVEHYLEEYEKTIPKTGLNMKPEFPPISK